MICGSLSMFLVSTFFLLVSWGVWCLLTNCGYIDLWTMAVIASLFLCGFVSIPMVLNGYASWSAVRRVRVSEAGLRLEGWFARSEYHWRDLKIDAKRSRAGRLVLVAPEERIVLKASINDFRFLRDEICGHLPNSGKVISQTNDLQVLSSRSSVRTDHVGQVSTCS